RPQENMAAKKKGRAGDIPPARAETVAEAQSAVESGEPEPVPEEAVPEEAVPKDVSDHTQTKDSHTMPLQPLRTDTPSEGVTVIGEAVRRVPLERAEFLIEITATAMTTAQALRDNHLRTLQVTQAIGALGVQPVDMQTISLKVHSLYSPVVQPMLPYAGMQ